MKIEKPDDDAGRQLTHNIIIEPYFTACKPMLTYSNPPHGEFARKVKIKHYLPKGNISQRYKYIELTK